MFHRLIISIRLGFDSELLSVFFRFSHYKRSIEDRTDRKEIDGVQCAYSTLNSGKFHRLFRDRESLSEWIKMDSFENSFWSCGKVGTLINLYQPLNSSRFFSPRDCMRDQIK